MASEEAAVAEIEAEEASEEVAALEEAVAEASEAEEVIIMIKYK